MLAAQEIVPVLNHQTKTVPAVEATYYTEGATEGKRCKLCGEWLTEPQVIPKKEIDFTFGDVNGDGKINVRDVTAIQRHLARYNILTDKNFGAADVNFDAAVKIDDATLLQSYLAEFNVTIGKQS